MWKFSNLNTLSSLAHCRHENEWEKCSQTLRGRKKGKFQSRYQLGLLDMKVLADLDFKWSSEMSSFWDSGLGKISNLVADKLKCRFRATRVFQKKLRYPFQFWLKVFLAKMREWERKREREREWNNQMFWFGRGKLGMKNYQIWEFFPVQTENWFFFLVPNVGSGGFLRNYQFSQLFFFF